VGVFRGGTLVPEAWLSGPASPLLGPRKLLSGHGSLRCRAGALEGKGVIQGAAGPSAGVRGRAAWQLTGPNRGKARAQRTVAERDQRRQRPDSASRQARRHRVTGLPLGRPCPQSLETRAGSGATAHRSDSAQPAQCAIGGHRRTAGGSLEDRPRGNSKRARGSSSSWRAGKGHLDHGADLDPAPAVVAVPSAGW